MDQVDADALRRALQAQAFCQRFDGPFAAGIGRDAGKAGHPHAGAGENQPAAAAAQMGQGSPRQVQGAEVVGVQHLPESFLLCGVEWAERAQAGVMHRAVDAAELLGGPVHAGGHLPGVPHVARQGEQAGELRALPLQRRDVQVQHRHPAAVLQQPEGEVKADAPRAAGDHEILQCFHFLCSFKKSSRWRRTACSSRARASSPSSGSSRS